MEENVYRRIHVNVLKDIMVFGANFVSTSCNFVFRMPVFQSPFQDELNSYTTFKYNELFFVVFYKKFWRVPKNQPIHLKLNYKIEPFHLKIT